MNARDIIKKPLLSEKSYDGIAAKKYTFEVDKHATKTQIKLAVEEVFAVKVEYVHTVNCDGKLKRMGKNEGFTPDYKKAIVQLKKESKPIEFFESLS
ncbi:MAG: 50S ribosomal protein L23 [Clostridia bacterium]